LVGYSIDDSAQGSKADSGPRDPCHHVTRTPAARARNICNAVLRRQLLDFREDYESVIEGASKPPDSKEDMKPLQKQENSQFHL
jgi:hypothetical protein